MGGGRGGEVAEPPPAATPGSPSERDRFVARREDEVARREAGEDDRRHGVPPPRDARPGGPQSDGRRGPRPFSTTRAPTDAQKLVDRLLASPDWADAWVGYWQDLLAENPSILKPTLNNSGPFRRWIHESFAANKPMDQFATELILMQGDNSQGGTAGFAISSGNDLPMAMKGHVLSQAFLAIDMKCARCHDAPYAPFEQSDLFGLAAMLDEKTLTVPKGSTVQVPAGARQPQVVSTLKVGDKVDPAMAAGRDHSAQLRPTKACRSPNSSIAPGPRWPRSSPRRREPASATSSSTASGSASSPSASSSRSITGWSAASRRIPSCSRT